MRKVTSYLVLFLLANVFTIAAFAQNVTISGNVRNSSTKEGAGAVSVTIKGADNGTFTDDKGNFKLSAKSLPVTLLISSVGYELQEVTVSKASDLVQVEFKKVHIKVPVIADMFGIILQGESCRKPDMVFIF